MARPLLVHHAAGLGRRYPPSSLSGLQACLEAGAQLVELDIVPLADGDFALLHDVLLERGTDGAGPVREATAAEVRRFHLRSRGALTDERVGTLSEAVALVAGAPGTLSELQLDLKAYAPLSDAALESLVGLIEPLGSQVRVSSTSDKAIRRLRGLAPALPLGFDPLRHIDIEPGPSPTTARYLCHCGAYGYLDDHPLAADRWGAAYEYLGERAQVLWTLVPVDAWYIRATLLAHMLDDGFDWIAWLHRHGAQVCAWTLNPDQPHHVALAQRLLALGVDRITTDDPEGWLRR